LFLRAGNSIGRQEEKKGQLEDCSSHLREAGGKLGGKEGEEKGKASQHFQPAPYFCGKSEKSEGDRREKKGRVVPRPATSLSNNLPRRGEARESVKKKDGP